MELPEFSMSDTEYKNIELAQSHSNNIKVEQILTLEDFTSYRMQLYYNFMSWKDPYEVYSLGDSLSDFISRVYPGITNDDQELSGLVYAANVFKVKPFDYSFKNILETMIPEKDYKAFIRSDSNIEVNQELRPIFLTLTERIPKLDASLCPLIDEKIILGIIEDICRLRDCKNFDAPFLSIALQNICIATPKIIKAESLDSAVNALVFACRALGTVEKKSWTLFYQALHTVIDLNLAELMRTKLAEMRNEGKEDHATKMFEAMLCAIFLNKKDKNDYNVSGRDIIEIMLDLSEEYEVDAQVVFLEHIDLTRLLFSMKDLIREFKKINNNAIYFAVELVLLDRLDELLSSTDADKGKLVCVIIEYLSLWSSSAKFSFHLALLWSSFTQNHEQAVKVLDLLISRPPPKFDGSDYSTGLASKVKRAIELVISKAPDHKKAEAIRERHLKFLPVAKRNEKLDEEWIRSFPRSAYFYTLEKSDVLENLDKPFYAYVNLQSVDLRDDQTRCARLLSIEIEPQAEAPLGKQLNSKVKSPKRESSRLKESVEAQVEREEEFSYYYTSLLPPANLPQAGRSASAIYERIYMNTFEVLNELKPAITITPLKGQTPRRIVEEKPSVSLIPLEAPALPSTFHKKLECDAYSNQMYEIRHSLPQCQTQLAPRIIQSNSYGQEQRRPPELSSRWLRSGSNLQLAAARLPTFGKNSFRSVQQAPKLDGAGPNIARASSSAASHSTSHRTKSFRSLSEGDEATLSRRQSDSSEEVSSGSGASKPLPTKKVKPRKLFLSALSKLRKCNSEG